MFIIRCKWNGTECDTSYFEQHITDMGQCFTFNGNPMDIQKSEKAGR